MEKGLIFDIKRFAIHDGEGIRTTIFFKGCPLRCWWCHNPESYNGKIENILKSNSNELEVVGKYMSIDDLYTEIEKDTLFYDESNGGVTFSGGEPLNQPDFLEKILIKCKENYISTIVDTSGYAPKENFEKIKKIVDYFLYDMKIMDDEKHKKYTGVSNQIILENLAYLAKNKKKIIIRIPVIPNINDDLKNINSAINFIENLDNIERVDLLPYHDIGKSKFNRLSLDYKLSDTLLPKGNDILEIKKMFEARNISVKIGG